jgi:hypothetical protein
VDIQVSMNPLSANTVKLTIVVQMVTMALRGLNKRVENQEGHTDE